MPDFSLQDICRWTGADDLAGSRQPPEYRLAGICTDSRAIRPGCLFIAMRGERFDGHDYLAQAVARGAGGLLIDNPAAVSRLETPAALPVLLVPDTLAGLQALAAGYRMTLTAPVIAVTGSVGKTSTRQMISACLAPMIQVHQTAANLNNEIGLPQTLLQAESEDQAIVLEMGMRGPGEIALLSRIARPDIAVITGIGWSHIGRLGSRSAILAAKAEIVQGLQPDGLLILNGDDPLLLELSRSLAGRRRLAFIAAGPALSGDLADVTGQAEWLIRADTVQTAGAQVSFTARMEGGAGALGPVPSVPVLLPYPGLHHVRNTLFGLAVARALRLDLDKAARGAAVCRHTGNRQRLINLGGIVLMDDSYNAAPESMQAALETLAGLAGPGRRKIAALGCMLELGSFAPEAHRQVGELVAKLGYQLLLVIGPQAEDMLVGARSIRSDLPSCACADHQEMIGRLMAVLQPGDHLLVKGSRGLAMEEVTRVLSGHLGGSESALTADGTGKEALQS